MLRARLLIACAFVLVAGAVVSAAWHAPTRSTAPLDPAAVPAQDRAPAPSLDPAEPMAGTKAADARTPRSGSTPSSQVALETTPKTTTREQETTTKAAAVSAVAGPGTPGRIAAIDPETGELAPPSAEQLQELFPLGTSMEPTQQAELVPRSDGIVVVRVGPQIQDYLFAEIGPDGKTSYRCGPASQDSAATPAQLAPTHRAEDR